MPPRDFRNTGMWMDLLARENYQHGRQMQDDKINAERRQAEYAGMGQLLKGVGQEQERIRASTVQKSGAQGVGAAIDEAGAPAETGDLERDAAAAEGYQGTRAKMAAAKAQQDALLSRLLAGQEGKRGHQQVMEEIALARLEDLRAHRDRGYQERDEDQAIRIKQNEMMAQLRALNMVDENGNLRFQPSSGGGFPVPGVEPSQGPGGGDPDFISWDKQTIAKRRQAYEELGALAPNLTQLSQDFGNLKDEDFGALAGGDIPVVSMLARKFGLPGNKNELQDTMVDAGVGSPEDEAASGRRAKYQAGFQDIKSWITKARSGTAASEPERRDLGEILGAINQKTFGRDPKIARETLQRFFTLYNTIMKREGENIQRRGSKRSNVLVGDVPQVGGGSGPARTLDPNDQEGIKQIHARATELLDQYGGDAEAALDAALRGE